MFCAGLLVKKTGTTWKYLAVKDNFLLNTTNYVFALQVNVFHFLLIFVLPNKEFQTLA